MNGWMDGWTDEWMDGWMDGPAGSFITNCKFHIRSQNYARLYSLNTTLNLRRPSFSSRRYTDLEQSSAAYHICSVTSRLLLSLEDEIGRAHV